MRNLRFKHTFVKKGNMTMVMIMSIVVVLTMVALCAFLVAVSKNQLYANDKSVTVANVDASVSAVEQTIDPFIEQCVDEMRPWGEIPGFPDLFPGMPDFDDLWFDETVFMTRYADKIKELTDLIIIDDATITVAFVERVPVYIHDVGTYYFDSIVVSMTFENGETHNVAFYIDDPVGEINDGVARSKGDYLFTWIT